MNGDASSRNAMPGFATALPPVAARIDGARLWGSLMEMAAVGATAAGGVNRQALTDEDGRGRDLFVAWCRQAGCEVRIDAIGNVFAQRPGRDQSLAPVLIGSHLDSQQTGGRFDGVYGVLAGLEVIRTLNEARLETLRPLVVASWTNEEGCRFVPAMLGSGVACGVHSLEFGLTRADKSGITVDEELARLGYRGSGERLGEVYAAFEAHIEQGPLLEATSTTIGVVTGIQGVLWLDLEFRGISCHAGPTPMDKRRDAWRAAAPLVSFAYALAAEFAPLARVTIGDVRSVPGSRNTVPHTLVLSVDMRHPDETILTEMNLRLRAEAQQCADAARVTVGVTTIWHMPATRFDTAIIDCIEASARELGYSHRRMVSGAGHDSLYVAKIAPTAMIFVPCSEGLSHNEAESAAADDLEAGANVLLQAVARTAGVAARRSQS